MTRYKVLQPINLYAMMIPVIMVVVFHVLTTHLGKTIGYFGGYGLYLLFLLTGIVIFRTVKKETAQIKEKRGAFYYGIAFIPVLATFFVAFLPTLPNITGKILIILIPYALLNGFLEELFWRNTFFSKFGNNAVGAYFVPTILFTCWHFALLFANGVVYHGGGLALVGGAGVMGAIWGLTMLKTKKIHVVIIAHVMVNFFAFSQLIYQNGFAG